MKTNLNKILIIIFFTITIIIFINLNSRGDISNSPVKSPAPKYTEQLQAYPPLKCNFYNEKSFRRSISHAGKAVTSDMEILGGISPHHLLADDYIAEFFKAVSKNKPELIFLVAPNHKNAGAYKISTTLSDWETPFGLLKSDRAMTSLLLREKNAGINSELMETDHSISSLLPYIKYFIPQAKLVPLMLMGDMELDSCVQLGRKLTGLSKAKKSLILASVDFSHYLSLKQADKMDEITLKAIQDRNLPGLRAMNNDNLDSPPSIITLLSAMNSLKCSGMKILGHSNSDRIGKTDTGYTTSYFTILFGK